MSVKSIREKAAFHFRYRWIGAPLFILGLLLFVTAFGSFARTHDWFVLLLSIGCAMLGLTSFGVNHDTAVAYSVELQEQAGFSALQGVMQQELEEDLNWDRSQTLSLKVHPKTAVMLPWLAIAIQSYVFLRLMCGWKIPFAGSVSMCSSFWFGG